ncbi:MAG: Hsp70 family protein [Candidatus Scalindua sp.]
MTQKKIVGIDLGTTFSVIAHINEDTNNAEIIPSPDQDRITASVVLFESENNIIVGEIAKQNAANEPTKVVEFVKRRMGRPKEDQKDEKGNVKVQGWSFENSGKKYSAQEISARILKQLKDDAEKRLGTTITDAVITCPAYFGDPERSATKEAGMIAGFNVLAIIDEPVAAALAYGLDKKGKDQKVFVFDLGGGTLDVVILEILGGKIREIAVDGDHLLGGKDWDDELTKYVADLFKEKYGSNPLEDLSSYQDLQLRAIVAKKQLSKQDKIKIRCDHAGNFLLAELTKIKFEELTAPLVDKCKMLCEKVLNEAKMSWKDIDTVLLVGGSTRMPMIKKMVAEVSGKTPSEDLNPDECVALGAVWQGAILGVQSGDVTGEVAKKLRGVSVQKVSSHNLGIIATHTVKGERNCLMIPKFTPLPYEKKDTFGTTYDNQDSALVQVMEGGIMDDEGTCDQLDCNKIGEAVLDNIPPHPAGSPIEVAYKYDVNGMLEVHAKDVLSGREIEANIEHTGGLSEQEISEARKEIQKISVSE